MKYSLIPVIIFIFFFESTFSQKRNAVWCFGDSAGIDFNNLNNPSPFTSGFDTRGSCVSISDTSGNLLFYADTRASHGRFSCQVFDRLNNLLPNGDSLHGEGWYNELLIVPFPNNYNLYYLLSVGVAGGGNYYGLYYSIIDMTQNGGLGDVIQKNVQLNNYVLIDALNGVKHANGRDWWIILKKYDATNSEFYKFLLTPTGILQYNVQSIGGNNTTGIANLTFNKTGNKILFTSYNGLIEVFDFDRCSGQMSNVIVIENEALVNPLKRYWGSAFSPDGTKIYVSTSNDTSYLFQYDLTAANIPASKDTLHIFYSVSIEGGALRLAPDDKIYMSNAWNDGINFNYPYPTDSASYNFINMNLSVINTPDSFGSACNFQPYSFYLGGKRTYWGLPNNPNYNMGPVIGSLCDSLNVGVVEQKKQNIEFDVYPNPTSGKIYLKLNNIKDDKFSLQLLDALGRVLVSEDIKISKGENTKELEIDNFSKGVYLIQIKSSSSNKVVRVILK